MEPYSLQTQWHAKAYDKTGAGEAGVPEGGENRGGLLQSDSLALWQNAPEPMDQNRTQKLPSH